ncbi:MAG: helix-turn-helix domain-containing protein [Candidatus Pacebacteria bacterium]|nr:helix-turn-helix domain-containing protein [Candidatus Paceibacterota bacterium]
MGEHKNLKEFFEEMFENSGMNCEKLSQLSGVPPHYIHALRNMEPEKLPAAPYVKGYIKRIADVMSFDPEELWLLYKNDMLHKTSGGFDKLPANRFAIKKLNKTFLAVSIIIVIVAVYFVLNYKNLFGQARLDITSPAETMITIAEPKIELAGKINPKDKLTVNGTEIITDSAGNFKTDYNLQLGMNTVEFKVKKLLGQEKIETYQIIYQK